MLSFQPAFLALFALPTTIYALPQAPSANINTSTPTTSTTIESTTRIPDPMYGAAGGSGLSIGQVIPATNYSLIAALRASPNQVTRIALLEDSDFVFDFLNPPNENPFANQTGRGGSLINAFSVDFPALVDTGMAMAVGFTKPCGWVGLFGIFVFAFLYISIQRCSRLIIASILLTHIRELRNCLLLLT